MSQVSESNITTSHNPDGSWMVVVIIRALSSEGTLAIT